MTVTSVRKLGNGFHLRTVFPVYAEWDPSEPENYSQTLQNTTSSALCGKPYNHPKEYSNEFYWLSSGEINIYWLSPPDFFEDFSITSRGLGLVS